MGEGKRRGEGVGGRGHIGLSMENGLLHTTDSRLGEYADLVAKVDGSSGES